MNRIKKAYCTIISISLIVLVVSINLPACLGADSPKYIQNVFAVDSTGTSLTPVTAEITPSESQITIAIAVTTQVPTGLSVKESGFTISGSGTPNPGLNSVSNPVTTVQNANGSLTSKYLLQITVYPGSGVTSVGLTFFNKVVEVTGQPAVTHEANMLQFTVKSTATPTPTTTPTPSPSPTTTSATPTQTTPTSTADPTPTPTVPEFSMLILTTFAVIAGLIAVAAKFKMSKKPFF